MIRTRFAFALVFLLTSTIASANDVLAQRVLSKYIHGLEGGMRSALSVAENGGISVNQLTHLNRTIMRNAVREELPNIIVTVFRSTVTDAETFKAAVKNQPELIKRGVDLVVTRAYEMLDNYHKHAADLKRIGFKTPQPYTADGEVVRNIIKGIDAERATYRLPEVSRELLASNGVKHIVDANYFISKFPSGSARLDAYLGKDYIDRLLKNLLKAAI